MSSKSIALKSKAQKRKAQNLPALLEETREAADFLKKKTGGFTPQIGMILGTGLGALAAKISSKQEISYQEIPHFASSTVKSHAGKLGFGELAGKKVMAMEGRFHMYEGFSLAQVTFPVRVMKALGVKTLIVSNASGGLNPQYQKGDLVIVTDHINFTGFNPLIGPNHESLGPRFPDMSEPYAKRLIALTEQAALDEKLTVRKGVYIGVTGPNLETAAEYRMMRLWGADLVGMSTVNEVIVARHAGLEVLGLSVVTDMGLPDALHPVRIEEIIQIAESQGPKLDRLLERVIGKM
ncbi:MAG: purine-nucleoside phosphorylase [Candidatus Omnitrophica bacterium]|nr:purine-nucleoside phosphorylase [Candidatus Omnitrophota bacterium]